MDTEDLSGRVLFPTPAQGPWLPFLRLAETSTTRPGGESERHTHRREEVLNYMVEGEAQYVDDAGERTVIGPGAVALLTAREEGAHDLVPKAPPRARWVSVVVRCPSTVGGPPSVVQIARGGIPTRFGEGTVERQLAGRGGAVASSVGLDCRVVEFRADGACRCPVGRGRRGFAYLLEGSGHVDGSPVAHGSGALLNDIDEVEIVATVGTQVFLGSAPRG
jgi:redox-sensitive bicupin YhaK (pirin superfamily)